MDGKIKDAEQAIKKRKGCSLTVAHKFVTRAIGELENMAALVNKPEILPARKALIDPLDYLSCGKKCDPNCNKHCPEKLKKSEAKESFKTKAKKRKGYWGL